MGQEQQKPEKMTAVQIIDSVIFAQKVEQEINHVLAQREKVARKGKLKADAVGGMIRENRFNPEYIVNMYVKVLLKESNLSRRDREVVNIIGTNAYIQAEKILNHENE
jgi:hypothetical protein